MRVVYLMLADAPGIRHDAAMQGAADRAPRRLTAAIRPARKW